MALFSSLTGRTEHAGVEDLFGKTKRAAAMRYHFV